MGSKPKIEEVSSAEYSTSSDDEIYTPENVGVELEVDESAYNILEHISLDWPSQTIEYVKENEIMLATNPTEGSASLIRMNFGRTENFTKMKYFDFYRVDVDHSFNRIRKFGDGFACLSDENLNVFDKKLVLQDELKGKFGYGLATDDSNIYVGMQNGNLSILNDKETQISLHKMSIESIDVHENFLFTASCDHSIKITDLRDNKEIFHKVFDADINAISYNKNNVVAFGDDNGVIRIMDIRNFGIEEIKWHKSPISCVKWKNEDVFASCSDEQVALWDISFEEEWEYHKYLNFVHQGQEMYKDVAFDSKVIYTTSYDGICIFDPYIEELAEQS